MPHAPASHDFSGPSAKAVLSSEESLNEESLCREPKLAEPFCEEAFEGWPLGEAPCLPTSAASDANAGTTVFAGGAAGAAASSNEAAGTAAFAGAPSFADAPVGSGTFAGAAVGSTTFVGTAAFAGEAFSSTAFAGAIAATSFPQFMQNLASRGSFAPHFVQYMPVILYLIRFFSLAIVSPDASGTCQRPPMRASLHDFFTRFIPLFRNTPFDYSCIVETIPNEKRGHVLQPLRNRKREHSEVLPPMRKRAPSKRAIE